MEYGLIDHHVHVRRLPDKQPVAPNLRKHRFGWQPYRPVENLLKPCWFAVDAEVVTDSYRQPSRIFTNS